MSTAPLSQYQTALQATQVQQAATLAGSIQTEGAQAIAKAPPGASVVQQEAIGLEAQVSGTLAASIQGAGTPPPAPLEAPGTNQFQSTLSSETFNNTETLLGTLGLGTNANTLA